MAFPTTEMPGHETLRDRVRAALDRLIEAPDVDFKQSAEWEALRVKIIKGVLAMGNLRDGGIIVVGVAERGHNWELEGISDAHLATYETDIVHDSLDQYVSPASNVEVVLHEHNGKRYLVFHVHESRPFRSSARRMARDSYEEACTFDQRQAGRAPKESSQRRICAIC
jgi:predicted HTH transcriptional regulator